MKYVLVLFLACALSACTAGPANVTVTATQSPKPATASPSPSAAGQANSPQSVVDFLITSAASDFHTHGPKGPLQFRDVRSGHITTHGEGDETQYLLCGQYGQSKDGGDVKWTPFVTIKTSGYEQYIGGQADSSYCQKPGLVWDSTGDLSATLKSKLDALP